MPDPSEPLSPADLIDMDNAMRRVRHSPEYLWRSIQRQRSQFTLPPGGRVERTISARPLPPRFYEMPNLMRARVGLLEQTGFNPAQYPGLRQDLPPDAEQGWLAWSVLPDVRIVASYAQSMKLEGASKVREASGRIEAMAETWVRSRLANADWLSFDDRTRCETAIVASLTGSGSGDPSGGRDTAEPERLRVAALLRIRSPWQSIPKPVSMGQSIFDQLLGKGMTLGQILKDLKPSPFAGLPEMAAVKRQVEARLVNSHPIALTAQRLRDIMALQASQDHVSAEAGMQIQAAVDHGAFSGGTRTHWLEALAKCREAQPKNAAFSAMLKTAVRLTSEELGEDIGSSGFTTIVALDAVASVLEAEAERLAPSTPRAVPSPEPAPAPEPKSSPEKGTTWEELIAKEFDGIAPPEGRREAIYEMSERVDRVVAAISAMCVSGQDPTTTAQERRDRVHAALLAFVDLPPAPTDGLAAALARLLAIARAGFVPGLTAGSLEMADRRFVADWQLAKCWVVWLRRQALKAPRAAVTAPSPAVHPRATTPGTGESPPESPKSQMDAEATQSENAPGPTPPESGTDLLSSLKPDAMFTATQLAETLGVNSESLRKRLERWREKNPGSDGWLEDSDRNSRQPKYLYRVEAVRGVLTAVLASGEASAKRPAKTKLT